MRKDSSPFFAYIHVLYPHQPYSAPAPYDSMFGEKHSKISRKQRQLVINQYDAEIRYTDDMVGELFESLKKQNLLDSTYFVITSDHGEEFWEHGRWEHGRTFYNESIRVPLIIYPPGGRKKQRNVIDSRLSNIDLYPSILDNF